MESLMGTDLMNMKDNTVMWNLKVRSYGIRLGSRWKTGASGGENVTIVDVLVLEHWVSEISELETTL